MQQKFKQCYYYLTILQAKTKIQNKKNKTKEKKNNKKQKQKKKKKKEQFLKKEEKTELLAEVDLSCQIT